MYRLWIVEDDMGIAEAIQTQAELWDMQVRCVRNFRNVMAEFADFDPHIVLLDISLPFFNGYHWCSEIRKVSKVPIIFISSASDNLNMVMAMNLGADDFIAKPFDQSVLMAKLQALLRRTYDFGAPQQVLEHRGALLGHRKRPDHAAHRRTQLRGKRRCAERHLGNLYGKSRLLSGRQAASACGRPVGGLLIRNRAKNPGCHAAWILSVYSEIAVSSARAKVSAGKSLS